MGKVREQRIWMFELKRDAGECVSWMLFPVDYQSLTKPELDLHICSSYTYNLSTKQGGDSWYPVIILTQMRQQRSSLVLLSFSKTNLDSRGRLALLSAAKVSSPLRTQWLGTKIHWICAYWPKLVTLTRSFSWHQTRGSFAHAIYCTLLFQRVLKDHQGRKGSW